MSPDEIAVLTFLAGALAYGAFLAIIVLTGKD